MKTFLKIFFLLALICLAIGCNRTDEFEAVENLQLKSAQPHTVTVPFKANLLGEITNLDAEDPECADEGYVYRVTVEVTGNATHMGKVSLTFDFCTAGPPDPNIPNSIYTYAPSSSIMTAANGDKLLLDFGGSSGILNSGEYPDYVTDYWRDIATITGGTGRFEGASGELLMDDYCTNIDEYTHHHWKGTITLVKGTR